MTQASIARGMVQVTAILAIGAKRETCPNWNIMIGIEKLKAESVSIRASWIAKVWGTKKNIFLKKSCV